MAECPNCGNKISEGDVVCQKCGNPLADERPWEVKTKRKNPVIQEISEKPVSGDGPKVQTVIRGSLGGKIPRKQKINIETYLDNDFVIGTGLCGYSTKAGEYLDLISGTVIMTKRAILFGKSEYDIRCGRYSIEIPLKIVDSYWTEKGGGKKLIAFRTTYDEVYYFFVSKIDEWLQYFSFALEKPAEKDVAVIEEEDFSPKRKWITVVVSCFLAVAFFYLGFQVDGNGIRSLLNFAGAMCLTLSVYSIFLRRRKK